MKMKLRFKCVEKTDDGCVSLYPLADAPAPSGHVTLYKVAAAELATFEVGAEYAIDISKAK
jgi:hypothetical protein